MLSRVRALTCGASQARAAISAQVADATDPKTGDTRTVLVKELRMDAHGAADAGHEGMAGEVWRQTVASASNGA